MIINNESFKINNIFDSISTVPDCFVVSKNKIGEGHGEAKFYFASRSNAYNFFGKQGYRVKCIILKQDLINYMHAIKAEYQSPSQEYRAKNDMPQLWQERMSMVESMNEIETFTAIDQCHLNGDRAYVNADVNDKSGYKLIREISLPLVSYVQIMELKDNAGSLIYYWKLFADFDAIYEKRSVGLVLKYGKGEEKEKRKNKSKGKNINLSRVGQGLYRSNLLKECPFCPITSVADERLLIASHIKPWSVSNDMERLDAKNGFMLTPVYDKLFDRGFITFSNDKILLTSNWVNPSDFRKLNVTPNNFYQLLPLDDERIKYLEYHRNFVFKG